MSNPKPPVTLCPRCGGDGVVVLDAALVDCLASLREGTPATSSTIHQRMQVRGYKCQPTAVMNQLSKLCRLRLAVRRGKNGKSWLYRLPSPPKDDSLHSVRCGVLPS